MNKPLHLIYVPGLGDRRVTGQQRLVNTWKWWGVTSELFQMNWADGEAWERKFVRLLARIDAAIERGQAVGLVGASAGATAVMNAYHARQQQVVGVVLVAGKINRPQAISTSFTSQNAAFGPAAHAAVVALAELPREKRTHILSRFALLDLIVPAVDSRVPGARNRVVPSIGHAFTIATQLLFGAPSFIRFLKKQPANDLA